MRFKLFSILLAVLLCLVVSNAFSSIIMVPVEQPTIQAGIDAAVEGDTVLVADGIFTGAGNYDLSFGGINLVVMSENGPDFTSIDCGNLGRAFNFLNHETSSSKVVGFKIADGNAVNAGGAIYCDSASPVIENCVFAGNMAKVRGGAIYATNESPVQIIGCKFIHNGSETYGGAVYLHWGSDAVIGDCVFDGNRAIHGGALIIDKSSPLVYRNLFIHNKAEQLGGAVFVQDDCFTTFKNCTLVDNFASAGSAFYIEERYNYWPVFVVISRCILVDNKYSDPIVQKGDQFTISCTDIYNNEAGDWVGSAANYFDIHHNFSSDPLFCDLENDDYHISNTSPCVPENNGCGDPIGALGVGCYQQHFVLDIKPGSCPNPINMKDKGSKGKAVLPVAILGAEGFDVNDIDVSTISLLSTSPVRFSYEDVGSPVELEDECNCTEEGSDGYVDLTLKFSREEIVKHMMINYSDDPDILITLSGKLNDGSDFFASDCILLKHDGDLNLSGEMDLDDLVMFIDYLLNEGETPQSLSNADFNNDNSVDVSDLLDMVSFMFTE